jgi:hypothetical protein
MSETTELAAVKVHVVGSDVTLSPARSTRKEVHTTLSTASIAKVVANGVPSLLLSHAPNRTRASLTISGTAGDTVILSGSMGEAQAGSGAVVGPLTAPLVLCGDDEVWLGQGTGVSIVVGIIAEYES